jgi:L-lactate dehydrogenase (cytochrome)
MAKLDRILNVGDFRKLARRKLPAPLFNYIDGGSDEETNVLGNTRSFDSTKLVPEYLVDITNIDLSTRVLGREI